ncbi:MAG: thioredoxin family protein [Phycisphaeraceae bacterium]|nr:thioredoxin family protein [Phycisphaeraceae bacterium]MCW5753628.1 thioredoxin family protein [Phycisphaeraceae bacterium]
MSKAKKLLAGLAGCLAIGGVMLSSTATASEPEKSATKQVAKVGEKAPNFVLKDLDGKEHELAKYTADGKIVVLEWFNAECPFVKKHHTLNKTMYETHKAFKDKDVVWIAINSGAPGEQGTGVEFNKKAVKDFEMAYPLALDESGKVGRMYGAKTTPHMYVIDRNGILAYAGAIDNNRSARQVGDINYVKDALKALTSGETVATRETEAYGCSVKYGKKGG